NQERLGRTRPLRTAERRRLRGLLLQLVGMINDTAHDLYAEQPEKAKPYNLSVLYRHRLLGTKKDPQKVAEQKAAQAAAVAAKAQARAERAAALAAEAQAEAAAVAAKKAAKQSKSSETVAAG